MRKICISVMILGVAWLVAGGQAVAAGSCPMSYQTFETAVPHIDLEACPKGSTHKNAFCRASTGGDQVHIFFFANDDKQCLLEVKSYDEESFSFELKAN